VGHNLEGSTKDEGMNETSMTSTILRAYVEVASVTMPPTPGYCTLAKKNRGMFGSAFF
jgi:hypothetical protein